MYLKYLTFRMETRRGVIWSWSVLDMDDESSAHQYRQYRLNMLCTQQVSPKTDTFNETHLKYEIDFYENMT